MRRKRFVLILVPLLATTAMATPQGAELGKLVGLDSAPGDGFGSAVALSGERALVGAPEHDAFFADDGAAYLFERPDGVWIQVAKLVPSDPLAGSNFGTAVALDGGRAVVTRPAVFGVPGAVYVFELQAGAWVETAKIPGGAVGFGSAVALAGNDLLVGAPKSSSGAFFCGTAYVFELQGGAWVLASELPPPFCTFSSNKATYGASVALSGDRALVGKEVLIGKGCEQVPAYLFERAGGVWSATAELASGSACTTQEVTVALHGDVALLGLPLSLDARGNLQLYQGSGASWHLQDTEFGAMPGDRLGHSVAVAGGRALAGAPGDDTAGADAGAVYAFTVEEQFGSLALLDKTKLPTATLAPGGGLGAAVALSGDLLLAGAPDGGAGTAAVFSALAFDASPAQVSVGSGGSQVLSLGAGTSGAGALFAILGSVSGTAPGQTLGGMAIPLNPDPYFTYTLTHVGQPPLAGGAGLLGPTGGATASFALPAGSSPALIGVVGNHAFVLVDLATLTVTFASNPAEVLLVP